MSRIWQTLKVFVSSTFHDLELERDRLSHIFHGIEKDIIERELTVRPYDLRWRDRLSTEPVADWCVKMVKGCQYFIGILAHRYGSRPVEGPCGEPNTERLSITEMEINQAISSVAPERRFFCFKKNQGDIKGETESDLASIEALKQRLISAGECVYWYQEKDELFNIIDQGFRKIIDREFPPGQKAEPLTYTYIDAMNETVEEKVKGFVGRETYLERLHDFCLARDIPNYMGIYALAGTGKSALLARFVQRCKDDGIPVVAHFMSMAGNVREVNAVISSIGEQLKNIGVLKEEINPDAGERRIQVHSAIRSYKAPLVLIFDGLDEVSENGRDLSWLPRFLPPNVRVIASTRPVDTWDRLKIFPDIIPLELPPLNPDEITLIIDSYSKTHTLELSRDDQEALKSRAQGNPLFLKVALDEVLATGVAVGQLALTIEALFDQILERLERRHGKDIMRDYLGLIAAGRAGIMEKELSEILSIGDDLLFTITRHLSNFIITQRGFLNFFHPEFKRTVMMRMGKSGMRKEHTNISEYLMAKGYGYIRTLDELCYQLQWSEKYKDMLAVLTDIEFLEAKSKAGMIAELGDDFEFALNGMVVRIPENIGIDITKNIRVTRDTCRLLGRALDIDMQFLKRHPDLIFQSLWNHCYWHDCPEAFQHYKTAKSKTRPPWQNSDNKLYLLAEHWRKAKEDKEKLVWLKTRRPLQSRLDSPILKIFTGHKFTVTSVAISPDGSRIISGSKDRTARVWDSQSGELIHVLSLGHDDVDSVHFSPNGRKIATGIGSTLIVWDSQSGEMLKKLTGHENSVYSVRFSPDGTRLASGSQDKTIRIWDAGKEDAVQVLSGHDLGVHSVDFNQDGSKVVSGSVDKTVVIWDLTTGKIIHRLSGHKSGVNSVRFSPDGAKVISGSNDGTIKIWDSKAGKLITTLTGHEGGVYSVGFSPDGLKILSGSEDGTIRVWDTQTGKQVYSILGHESVVRSVEFTTDGRRILSGSKDRTVRVWNAQMGIDYTLLGHESLVRNTWFASDYRKVVSKSDDIILEWDAQTGKCLREVKESPVNIIETTPEDIPYRLVTSDFETAVENKKERCPIAFFPRLIQNLMFSKNNMLTGSVGNYVYILELRGV